MSATKRRRSAASLAVGIGNGLAGPVMVVWLAVTTAMVITDQIAMIPPRPPTVLDISAATPQALADWKIVYARLSNRLPYAPPELGEVWTVSSGRICGLINSREMGVDNMVPFYTVGLTPLLRDDDPRRYFRDWLDCVGNHWVRLHAGTQDTGFCASDHGRATPIAALICTRS